MKSNTENSVVFDLGSLYAEMSKLTDNRDARGMRYQLANILAFILIGKLCGEDQPSGMPELVMHRIDLLMTTLQIECKNAPYHSTYRQILGDIIDVIEDEQVRAGYLTGKHHFGRQVVVVIDGKIMRGTVVDEKPGLHLLAAYLPAEGRVLMKMQVEHDENKIPMAPKVLQCIDLRGKVIIPRLKKLFVSGLSLMLI